MVDLMSIEKLTTVAAEAEDAQFRRQHLDVEIAILKEGSKQCKKYRRRSHTSKFTFLQCIMKFIVDELTMSLYSAPQGTHPTCSSLTRFASLNCLDDGNVTVRLLDCRTWYHILAVPAYCRKTNYRNNIRRLKRRLLPH